MRAFFVIRCIMLALGALLAVALITRGNIFIGVIVGALVACRAALLVARTSRRREFRRRIQARRQERLGSARRF